MWCCVCSSVDGAVWGCGGLCSAVSVVFSFCVLLPSCPPPPPPPPPPPHPQTLINGSFFLSLTHLFTVIYSLSLLSLFPCCASSHSLSGSHSRSLTPSLSLLLFLTPPVALVRTLRPNPEPPFSACFTQCPCPSPPTLSLVPTAWTLQN